MLIKYIISAYNMILLYSKSRFYGFQSMILEYDIASIVNKCRQMMQQQAIMSDIWKNSITFADEVNKKLSNNRKRI